MSMRISHPWLARLSLRIGQTEGGTQTRDECSPSRCPPQAAVVLSCPEELRESGSPMSLRASTLCALCSRGAFCRALVQQQPRTAAQSQPGRERPPLPPPGPGPGPFNQGVAHAPAACLARPDKRDRALVVDTTRCMVTQRDARSQRTAPRDGHRQSQLLPDRRTLCH
jgi:hypothetical protein